MDRPSKELVCLGHGGGNQELDLGHVVFIIHIRHPGGHAWVAVEFMNLKIP